MKARFLGLAAFAGAVLLSPICSVEACGPDFEPDVFVSTSSPDDPAEFAKGHLGILQARFDSKDYAVAFRYLNGGKLSEAERQIYVPPAPTLRTGLDFSNMTPQQIAAAERAYHVWLFRLISRILLVRRKSVFRNVAPRTYGANWAVPGG